MYDKAIPVPPAENARFEEKAQKLGAPQEGGANPDSAESGRGEGLRAFDWGELTSRLDAARDFRHVLKRDRARSFDRDNTGFVDAAARYLRTREDGEPDVNPIALEHCKSSPGITSEPEQLHPEVSGQRGQNANGDARED